MFSILTNTEMGALTASVLVKCVQQRVKEVSHPLLPFIPPSSSPPAAAASRWALDSLCVQTSPRPWWPQTGGTALTTRTEANLRSPSEGRSLRACSWITALCFHFQREIESGGTWCWWCVGDGGFPFCASMDWCTPVIRASLIKQMVNDTVDIYHPIVMVFV